MKLKCKSKVVSNERLDWEQVHEGGVAKEDFKTKVAAGDAELNQSAVIQHA